MKDQFIYKIWDTEKEKYYSTGKKSSWKSGTWAVAAVKDLNYFYANQGEKESTWERYEIHKMELTVVETFNVKDILFTNEKIEKQLSDLTDELQYITSGLDKVMGVSVSFSQLVTMQKEGLLSEEAESRLIKIQNKQSEINSQINKLKGQITTI